VPPALVPPNPAVWSGSAALIPGPMDDYDGLVLRPALVKGSYDVPIHSLHRAPEHRRPLDRILGVKPADLAIEQPMRFNWSSTRPRQAGSGFPHQCRCALIASCTSRNQHQIVPLPGVCCHPAVDSMARRERPLSCGRPTNRLEGRPMARDCDC
jgi:hypothetical protein